MVEPSHVMAPAASVTHICEASIVKNPSLRVKQYIIKMTNKIHSKLKYSFFMYLNKLYKKIPLFSYYTIMWLLGRGTYQSENLIIITIIK
jgi:hypothetical protein